MPSVYDRVEAEARMFDPDPYWDGPTAADMFDPPPDGLDARDWLTWLDHVPTDRFADALEMLVEDYSHVVGGIIAFAVGMFHVDEVCKPLQPAEGWPEFNDESEPF